MKSIVSFISFFLLAIFSIANDSKLSGVYLSYKDFKVGKLTNSFNPLKINYTIWPQGFFKYKDIEFKTLDTTIVYKRSDIWGYTDHKQRLIRVFNNNHYIVLCDKELIVYIIYSPTKTSYHFSKTLNDTIHRLTKKNLSTAYANNSNLLNRINAMKKKQWLFWVNKTECFLLNELYTYY